MSDEEADRAIDDIGVIARVAPEDKVHLVEILRRKGHIVAMTGDGVNDAPALKTADIGVAMGITGTEVSKEAAVMILTDDNFATIVKAVELGRALYDNLMRYIRFQMASLFGFIATFLGASIFNILGGVPFLPLQTLWINFTVDVFQAIGLGYGKPREGPDGGAAAAEGRSGSCRGRCSLWLLVRRPRDGRGDARRHRLGDRRLRRGRRPHDGPRDVLAVPRLLLARDGERGADACSAASSSRTRSCSRRPALSLLTIFLATTFGPLQRILDTTELSVDQWAICIVVAASIIVVAEVRKLFGRRRRRRA